MRMSFACLGVVTAAGLLLAGTFLFADGTPILRFHAAARSAGPTADEATPMTFGNPDFQQRSVADRDDPAGRGAPNSGSLGHDHGERDRPAQGPLPVHRVRDRPVGRAAPRPADRRDRDHLAQPESGRLTSRSMPATGRRGARSSPPRNRGARTRPAAPPAPTVACSS